MEWCRSDFFYNAYFDRRLMISFTVIIQCIKSNNMKRTEIDLYFNCLTLWWLRAQKGTWRNQRAAWWHRDSDWGSSTDPVWPSGQEGATRGVDPDQQCQHSPTVTG